MLEAGRISSPSSVPQLRAPGLNELPDGCLRRGASTDLCCGGRGAAAALGLMVAVQSHAAADVRTGHIADHAAGNEPTGPATRAPEAAPSAMSFTRSPALAAAGVSRAV